MKEVLGDEKKSETTGKAKAFKKSGVQGNFAIAVVPVHGPVTEVRSLPAQGIRRANDETGI